jgi:hypothetical protein
VWLVIAHLATPEATRPGALRWEPETAMKLLRSKVEEAHSDSWQGLISRSRKRRVGRHTAEDPAVTGGFKLQDLDFKLALPLL